MGCHSLLQGIFQTQGLNQGLLHCRQMLYHLSHQGSPQRSLPWSKAASFAPSHGEHQVRGAGFSVSDRGADPAAQQSGPHLTDGRRYAGGKGGSFILPARKVYPSVCLDTLPLSLSVWFSGMLSWVSAPWILLTHPTEHPFLPKPPPSSTFSAHHVFTLILALSAAPGQVGQGHLKHTNSPRVAARDTKEGPPSQ